MLNCHKLNGKFEKKITVQTNDPEQPTVVLTCKGQILEAIKLTPNRLYFGQIPRGKDVEKTVVLTRGDAGPISPKLLSVKPNDVTAELREVEPNEKYELVVRASPTASTTRVNANIRMETGVKDDPILEIRAYGNVQPRVVVAPSRLAVPHNAKVGWNQTVTVNWTEGGPFKVLDAQFDQEGFAVEANPDGRRWKVTLSVVGDHEAFRGSKSIVMKTDDEKQPILRVPVLYRRPPVRRTQAARVPVPRRATPVPKPTNDAKAPAKADEVNPPAKGGAERVKSEPKDKSEAGKGAESPSSSSSS